MVLFFLLVLVSPKDIEASAGLISPTSPLYFLQTWGEDAKLFFTFSKDQKVDYLLSLTQKRVDEMGISPSSQIGNRYDKHFQDLESLSSQVSDKVAVVQKIEDASLRQQAVLAGVYVKVPDVAKGAILNAQENSSKHVANTIEAVEGTKGATTYTDQAQAIQKAEQIGRVEQVQMESAPNGNPSDKNINPIKDGQGLNPLNPINGQNDSGVIQPAAPIPQK